MVDPFDTTLASAAADVVAVPVDTLRDRIRERDRARMRRLGSDTRFEKELRVLTRDVKNPRKRDKRKTATWSHNEVIKAGLYLILDVEVRIAEDGTEKARAVRSIKPRGGYGNEAVHEWVGRYLDDDDGPMHGETLLFNALLEASEPIPTERLGALEVALMSDHTTMALALLIQNGTVSRAAVIDALFAVDDMLTEENPDDEHDVGLRYKALKNHEAL